MAARSHAGSACTGRNSARPGHRAGAPRVLVQLIEAVLQRVLQASRAWASQPLSGPGPQRHQLEEGATDWPSSSNMDLDSGKNSTQGSSSTKDGATSYSACSSACRRFAAPDRRAGFGMPAWRKASRGAASRPAARHHQRRMRPASARPAWPGSFQRISSPPRAHPASRTECAGTAGRRS